MSSFTEERDPLLQSVFQAWQDATVVMVSMYRLSSHIEISQAPHKTLFRNILKMHIQHK